MMMNANLIRPFDLFQCQIMISKIRVIRGKTLHSTLYTLH